MYITKILTASVLSPRCLLSCQTHVVTWTPRKKKRSMYTVVPEIFDWDTHTCTWSFHKLVPVFTVCVHATYAIMLAKPCVQKKKKKNACERWQTFVHKYTCHTTFTVPNTFPHLFTGSLCRLSTVKSCFTCFVFKLFCFNLHCMVVAVFTTLHIERRLFFPPHTCIEAGGGRTRKWYVKNICVCFFL